MTIAEAVRITWKASGMTSEDFAKAIGYSAGSSLSNVVTARSRPSSKHIEILRDQASKLLTGQVLADVDQCFANYLRALAGRLYMRHYKAPRRAPVTAYKAVRPVVEGMSLAKKRAGLVENVNKAKAALEKFDNAVKELLLND